MVSLRDIRTRIKSVNSTEKITKAMKMVAAAKLKKAVDLAKKCRAYNDKMKYIVQNINSKKSTSEEHPFLIEKNESKAIKIIVVTSNRGLCGAFNNNVVKQAVLLSNELKEKNFNIDITTIGNKGFNSLKSIKNVNVENINDAWNCNMLKLAFNITNGLCNDFLGGKLNSAWLLYNYFVTPMTQIVKSEQILPIKISEEESSMNQVEYIYEPKKNELIDYLIPKYIESTLYQSFVESSASEHGARMCAMENATTNAKDMSKKLTLYYNRARQASITKELMEIIGGAEALK